MGVSFLLPKPKYQSLNILTELKIPTEFGDWTSIDLSKELNLQDDRYNFISNVFARLYKNSQGNQLLFLILDAGNFHNPKICYTRSGFSVKDLGDVNFSTSTAAFKANALYMQRHNQGIMMFYWLCIDKKIVNWTGQKITELWSSLLNQKKVGLMVRLEIQTRGESGKKYLALGREFISSLNGYLTAEEKEYLFGK